MNDLTVLPPQAVVGRFRFIRKLDDFRGVAALVQDTSTEAYYAVSAVILPSLGVAIPGYPGPEIMVFTADEQGEVTSWVGVATWRKPLSLAEVLAELSLRDPASLRDDE